jgi:hypothetical protein
MRNPAHRTAERCAVRCSARAIPLQFACLETARFEAVCSVKNHGHEGQFSAGIFANFGQE